MLDPTKKYKLKGSTHLHLVNPIVIATSLREDARMDFPIAGWVEGSSGIGSWATWTADGKYKHSAVSTTLDLVEDKPEWEDWPIDTPVLYKDADDASYMKGYYAGEAGGKPTVWSDGGTSWSKSHRPRYPWDSIILACSAGLKQK